MDWSWVASCRNRGQPGLRFPKRKTRRPRLICLRRRLDEKPTSERVLWPPCLLYNLQGAPEQGFCLLILPLCLVEQGQVVQARCHIRMLSSQHVLSDLEGTLEQRLCLLILSHHIKVGA